MWGILVLGAVILHSLGIIINRIILKEGNVREYMFVWRITSSLFYIPAAIFIGFSMPTGNLQWIGVIAGIVLYAIGGFTGFYAVRHTEASLGAPLGSLRVLFLLILSWLILGERVTITKFWGTVFIFIGAMVITWKLGAFKRLKEHGPQLTVLTAFIIAIIAIVEKFSMGVGVNPVFYGFTMYFVPGLIYGLLPENRNINNVMKFVGKNWKLVLASAFCYASMYYMQITAFKLADVSLVFPLLQLSILITILLSFFILKEKIEIKQRFIGGIIMMVGAMMILA